MALAAMYYDNRVAPLAGAWIETPIQSLLIQKDLPSHPSRVRGLKHTGPLGPRSILQVAPLAGAWIETGTLWKLLQNRTVAPLAGAWIETA